MAAVVAVEAVLGLLALQVLVEGAAQLAAAVSELVVAAVVQRRA